MEAGRKVRIGVIGIGARAQGLIETLSGMDFVEIGAICDRIPERMQEGLAVIRKTRDYPVALYEDYHELLKMPDIEGVIIATSWNEHISIAIASMKAGKYTAFEVGGASSIAQCWKLVETYEETGTPCMMLENCCYGRYELAVLNMIRQGLFGEIVHCDGGYRHDLSAIPRGLLKNHQRSFHHMKRNAELYPTHEIGPIAKYLNINRGNRFLTLTSMASKSRGLTLRAEELLKDQDVDWHPFALGDIVTTLIKCAGGETVAITHDTSLPRPYSRANQVQGTNGIWSEEHMGIHIKGRSPEEKWESIDEYLKEYEHPIWKEFLNDGVTGGHGGMDYLVLRAFIYCIQNRIETPINVYDAATWMAVTCLSEDSIAMGSMPVAFPDFTNGKWVCPDPMPEGPFSLDD